jgi:nicotinamide-nucleotide adenylyltransferase
MIHAALLESKIDLTRCYVIPIVNDENNARWLAHLRSMVPSFNILYSGNDFVTNLVSQEIKIKKPLFSKKNVYNGTNIRKQMARMQNWKKLVPNAVFRVIEEIGGVTRLKTLLKSDSYPQQW